MGDEFFAADRDEWRDRLVERGLEERVGGAGPPDLREPILAAVAAGSGGEITRAGAVIDAGGASAGRARWRGGALAVAVSLLIGAAGLLLPPMNGLRKDVRRSTEEGRTVAVRREQVADATVRQKLAKEAEETGDRAGAADEFAEAPGELMLQRAAGRPTRGAEVTTDGTQVGANVPVQLGMVVAPAAEPAAGVAVAVPAQNQAGVDDPYYFEKEVRYGEDARPALTGESLVVNGTAGGGSHRAYALDLAASGYGGGGRALGGRANVDFNSYGTERELLELGDRSGRGSELFSLGWQRDAGAAGDRYAQIVENAFLPVSAANAANRLSTFSIDVDTASYANVRQFLMNGNRLPPPDAVRIEELVNYFDYDYAGPEEQTEPLAYNAAMATAQVEAASRPFAAHVEVAGCPWAPEHRLVRIGIKGREVERAARPKSNLVFLVDVSGSMDEPQKLPLLVDGMRMLTRELGENDRVAIVVYASTEGMALESTRGDQQATIMAALDRLSAGGSTAGGAGIQLAYKTAAENFIEGGVNRVILCTDGDFNVGVTDTEELKTLAATRAKETGVFLTVIGFGRGNLNDAMMEAIADRGNGNYHYVDNRSEARKVLVEEMSGTLVTIAKDVKIQVEFNPARVGAYRLIGYENRRLAAQDFNDDRKDAGEIGAGHTVTALYEVVPAGQAVGGATATDELKYGAPAAEVAAASDASAQPEREASPEVLTLKMRYKLPEGDESTKLEFPVTDENKAFGAASADFQFAASVAEFGMLLRGSQHRGDATFAGVLEIAESASRDRDPHGYRREFVDMVRRARQLAGEK